MSIFRKIRAHRSQNSHFLQQGRQLLSDDLGEHWGLAFLDGYIDLNLAGEL